MFRRWASIWIVVGGMAVGVTAALSQDDVLDLETLFDQGMRLVEESVDPEILKALQEVADANRERLLPILMEVQRVLQGQYIVDLAAFGDAIVGLLPALEKNEETRAYAAWLRPRLDYFKMAQAIQVTVPSIDGTPPRDLDSGLPKAPAKQPPPAKGETVKVHAPVRLPVATPAAQRELWIGTMAAREVPKNADRYVTRLKPIFAAFGVPEELVWVAEVESSFDASAQSPVGAVGLFQLMPMTARSQGLAVGRRDERTHPEKSARGAAAYLKSLRERFGDWRLALAAYNAGEGRVQRLLDQTRGKTFEDIASKLPAETQLYVPKVEALVLRREGKKLSDLSE